MLLRIIKHKEREKRGKIKIVRSDKGGEYCGTYIENRQMPSLFTKFLEEEGFIA